MSFEELVSKINSLSVFVKDIRNMNLKNIRFLLDVMDNPQNKLKFIHVAGTNGKGSVSTMLANALTKSGLKTGLYTSPFVVDFRERFKINSSMISKEEFCNISEKIFAILNKTGINITTFEFITAVAFEWFKRESCDVVILEVGLGGRLDATNIINDSLVSIITSISYDHTDVLGDTLEKIAFEKSGIIKQNGNVVIYPIQNENVIETISGVAKEKKAQVYIPDINCLEVKKSKAFNFIINYKSFDIKLPLNGRYQVYNTMCVIDAIQILQKQFSIDKKHIIEGIEQTKLPARLEILSRDPLIILDGAHNENAFRELEIFIKEFLENKKIYCILGLLSDKDKDNMVGKIAGLCEKIYTVVPDNERAYDSLKLSNLIKKYNSNVVSCNEQIDKVLEKLISEVNTDSVILICGSLYLAKTVKDFLQHRSKRK